MFSKINEFLRHERKIHTKIKDQEKIVSYLKEKYLCPYFEDKSLIYFDIKPKKTISPKTIWQYWGQGFNDLPQPVGRCIDSVHSHLPNGYKHIFLTDQNIHEWIEIPSFVYERLTAATAYSRTFFSDILHLALLNAYGGVWVDATILLTGQIPIKYLNSSFFCFYRGRRPEQWKQWERFNPMYFSWRESFKVRMCKTFFLNIEAKSS